MRYTLALAVVLHPQQPPPRNSIRLKTPSEFTFNRPHYKNRLFQTMITKANWNIPFLMIYELVLFFFLTCRKAETLS